jgi:hypothetical protein
MPNRVALWSVAATLTAVAFALTACSGGATQSHVSSAVVNHYKGLPKGVQLPGGDRAIKTPKPWAAVAGARTIYVMTWGSGSCPRIPTSVTARDSGEVVIRTVELHDVPTGDAPCTADLAVTTSVVRLPAAVTDAKDLLVQIDGTTTRLASG